MCVLTCSSWAADRGVGAGAGAEAGAGAGAGVAEALAALDLAVGFVAGFACCGWDVLDCARAFFCRCHRALPITHVDTQFKLTLRFALINVVTDLKSMAN